MSFERLRLRESDLAPCWEDAQRPRSAVSCVWPPARRPDTPFLSECLPLCQSALALPAAMEVRLSFRKG